MKNYRMQDSCAICRNVYADADWDGAVDYICSVKKPKCRELSDEWYKWRRESRVVGHGICDLYVANLVTKKEAHPGRP